MQSATRHIAVGRLAPHGGFERNSRGPDHDAMSRRRLELVPRAEKASVIDRQEFLGAFERTFLSALQTRSFAGMLAVLRQCMTARLGPFSAEERRQQQLLQWLQQVAAAAMPAGYEFVPQAAHVAEFVLSKSAWAVFALSCCIEPFTRKYCGEQLALDGELSSEDSDDDFLRALEWLREDARLTAQQREKAVDELIELLQGVDALLVFQAPSDVDFFLAASERVFTGPQIDLLNERQLRAYRAQFIASALNDPPFARLLERLTTAAQRSRLRLELAQQLA